MSTGIDPAVLGPVPALAREVALRELLLRAAPRSRRRTRGRRCRWSSASGIPRGCSPGAGRPPGWRRGSVRPGRARRPRPRSPRTGPGPAAPRRQGRLGPLPLGDVLRPCSGCPTTRPRSSRLKRSSIDDGQPPAVAGVSNVRSIGLAAGGRRGSSPGTPRTRRSRNSGATKSKIEPAEHLLARVAEHLALGLVDADDPPLGVDLVIADRGLVVEPAEPLLGSAHLLRPLPFADVGDEGEEAERHVGVVAVEIDDHLDRDEAAVLAPILLLIALGPTGGAEPGERLGGRLDPVSRCDVLQGIDRSSSIEKPVSSANARLTRTIRPSKSTNANGCVVRSEEPGQEPRRVLGAGRAPPPGPARSRGVAMRWLCACSMEPLENSPNCPSSPTA